MSRLIPKNKPISSATAGNYAGLLADIKQRIRTAQVRTAMAGNASMLMLYWEIGGVLAERQKNEGWGAAVLPRLATDLHNDLPEVKGFSARNMRRMIQFHHEYPKIFSIWPPPVAKMRQPLRNPQFGHGSWPNWKPARLPIKKGNGSLPNYPQNPPPPKFGNGRLPN
jgi:hypothetical protein